MDQTIIQKIQLLTSVEVHLYLIGLFVVCFIFYKLFLKKITERRHLSLKQRFKSTLKYISLSLITSVIINSILWPYNLMQNQSFLTPYLFFTLLLFSSIALIKTSQVLLYLYLFLVNMSQGVPRLITNMFTFFFTIILVNIIATKLFDVQLSALLATSAVFSLVLGLALQDTLGNLFSGISLQIESSFRIGDWIEVHTKSDRWLGQVQEMNWRATFLMSFSDELIMIPNKTIAQSEITIISQGSKSIRVSHIFKFPHDVNIHTAKTALLDGINKVATGILKDPPVRILITDINESWILMKVFYSLENFSVRYRIGDQIISNILEVLKQNKIPLQSQKIEIVQK
jgi:small-conductance mechanosensitive channel